MKNPYSKDKTQKSIQNLQQNLPDHDVQNASAFQIANGAKICHDYSRNSLKRINANDSCFHKSIFKSVAAVGSRFTNIHFQACDFSGSNFQYCNFDTVFFEDNSFATGANFSHSIFMDCSFTQIDVRECTFFDCQFYGCSFSSSNINSITLENSRFSHCYVFDIDLAHLNLEYIQIDETTMREVTLPPYQLAYIIGGPSYLFATDDPIFVYTDNGKISIDKYKESLDDLLAYYCVQNDFFPMANIMIGLNEYEKALTYIQDGIRSAFDYFDFRMVKHYCKLVISCSHFSHTQLKFLYDLITELSYKKDMGVKELHSYFINIGEIRELLLNTLDDKERVEFIIKTDIDKDDLEGINELYNKISKIIAANCSADHINSVELRHNSPYELLVTCIDTMPMILKLIPVIYSLLSISGKALDVWQKFENVINTHNQNAVFPYEKEIKRLEVIKKEQDLEMQREDLKKDRPQVAAVSEIEHNIIYSDIFVADRIPPEYLHYKYTKKIIV
ncbi:MAG: pentapeptide repeat-containing protein [Bacteroidales bacterium]|nr:pentapeptide repeat-containing protein [Bacteroidales bacterium]MCM1415660.1 pentapeptide repeat-containing protein [bacterium]MCM1423906.1 pentapeptide repeat-containing protein [bacterium]